MARTYTGLDVDGDFEGRFPWRKRTLRLPGGEGIAYVDEGSKRSPLTFLCFHGNPTWSYLYRHFIEDLAPIYRVVAIDQVGFGRSDKPQDPAYYSLERHVQNAQAVATHLGLSNVVPVIQDWGGPIGMGYATRHPQSIAGVVVLNTWAFVTAPGAVRLPWLFRRLTLGRGGFKRILNRNIFTELFLIKGHHLDERSAAPYRAPHPTPAERVGEARFPQLIPQEGDTRHESYATMKAIEDGLARLREVPAIIVWAMKDVAFRKDQLERWMQVFPRHEGPHRLPEAKHYLQEDHASEILRVVKPWATALAATRRPPVRPRRARPATRRR